MEKQCNDPKLMQCGLEKCVAADGTVEWVAAHSKARLEPQGLGLVLGLGLGLGLGVAAHSKARFEPYIVPSAHSHTVSLP